MNIYKGKFQLNNGPKIQNKNYKQKQNSNFACKYITHLEEDIVNHGIHLHNNKSPYLFKYIHKAFRRNTQIINVHSIHSHKRIVTDSSHLKIGQ